MHSLVVELEHHGYYVLFAIVFAEAIGLPVPAALALLIAGGVSVKGPLNIGLVLLTSLFALLSGDSLLFLLGRSTGWWLLGILCKFSTNPDSCILSSAEKFRRNAKKMLLLAKFVPGLNSLAPPLAGSMNMRFSRFFPLDLGGALLYAAVWCSTGYLFSNFLTSLTNGYEAVSRAVFWMVVIFILIYFGYHLALLLRSASLSYVPYVSPAEVARQLKYGEVEVFDVRSHGYYSHKALRVQKSIRLEPNAILDHLETLPKNKELVLYCTCHREATSLRVARILQQHGFRPSIMKGGLNAWKKNGLPLEAVPADDIVLLPTFS